MTFYNPEPVSMVLREAEQAGYGVMTTSSRLVMRSPYNTAETYSEDVSSTPSYASSIPPPCFCKLILNPPVGGWDPHGNLHCQRFLQSPRHDECCQHGCSLPQRSDSNFLDFIVKINGSCCTDLNSFLIDRWRTLHRGSNLLARTSASDPSHRRQR